MRSRPYTKECCSYFHGINVGQLDGAFRIYQKTDSFPREQNGMHLWEDCYLVEIINPETGEPVPDGEIGELS